jgi:hypothetical protein
MIGDELRDPRAHGRGARRASGAVVTILDKVLAVKRTEVEVRDHAEIHEPASDLSGELWRRS